MSEIDKEVAGSNKLTGPAQETWHATVAETWGDPSKTTVSASGQPQGAALDDFLKAGKSAIDSMKAPTERLWDEAEHGLSRTWSSVKTDTSKLVDYGLEELSEHKPQVIASVVGFVAGVIATKYLGSAAGNAISRFTSLGSKLELAAETESAIAKTMLAGPVRETAFNIGKAFEQVEPASLEFPVRAPLPVHSIGRARQLLTQTASEGALAIKPILAATEPSLGLKLPKALGLDQLTNSAKITSSSEKIVPAADSSAATSLASAADSGSAVMPRAINLDEVMARLDGTAPHYVTPGPVSPQNHLLDKTTISKDVPVAPPAMPRANALEEFMPGRKNTPTETVVANDAEAANPADAPATKTAFDTQRKLPRAIGLDEIMAKHPKHPSDFIGLSKTAWDRVDESVSALRELAR